MRPMMITDARPSTERDAPFLLPSLRAVDAMSIIKRTESKKPSQEKPVYTVPRAMMTKAGEEQNM